jgi:hypothetical protein
VSTWYGCAEEREERIKERVRKKITMPVGYAKCFDARGVAGKVLVWPLTPRRVVVADKRRARRAREQERSISLLWRKKVVGGEGSENKLDGLLHMCGSIEFDV